ncbi:flagellar M-ring protein FliF [Oceanococcus atlanticus]|uniref:Flagellar M-ring protein n=1 Tax=Oceanococcus atlanticus TaxID=1317117 RepID=A0A1Y1SGC7_9GAMM|nr:flagellar basal-body MS-ring/collar protein FliF [Oceanococcus atlanticus]ORE88638.1 flagellar M-ring protein FliF [Oceanococcus atlanticus]
MSDIQTSAAAPSTPASSLQNFNLKDVWASPGVRQIAALVGVALAVAVGVTIFMWAQKPGMQTLYSGLNTQDEAEMVEALRQAGITFKQNSSGGAIQVAAEDVHRARLQLASQGLPRSAGGGFETMREEQGIGVSQFLENARYQHALETELSRTISQLQPVRSARVHLAIPQRSAFVRNRQQPSASVLVALYPGRRLEDGQVDAVVHLVASSIPELQASKVSVVDESGRLLNRSGDAALGLSTTQLEYRTRLEDTYRGRIEQLLLPVLGPGRVSAQVSVDLDFSALEETRESYAPDGKVLRSEQRSENRDVTNEAVGVPGALSNRVPNSAEQGEGSRATSLQQTRNYEVDRTLSHRRSDPGRLRRISVAVLVDHIPDVAAGGDKTKPLDAAELAQIENLVKDAVGFDVERGDTVSVSNLSFIAPQELAPMDVPLWDKPVVRSLGRQLLGAAVLLIIAFVILRPALRSALNPPYPVSEVKPAALAGAPAAAAGAMAVEGQDEAPRAAPLPPMERKLSIARDAVREDPKRVAQLMKQWVGDD